MDLHLGHELLLLHLDDDNGKGRLSESLLSAAYGGAVLCQWRLDGQLVEVKPKAYRLAQRGSRWASMQAAEAVMPDAPASLAVLLEALQGWRASNRYGPALKELHELGCVEPVKDRLLGLPWRTRWPERSGEVEEALIQRLRDHVAAGPGQPADRNDALLGILVAVGLLDSVWSPVELEALGGAIEARAQLATVGLVVRNVVKVERMLSGVPKL
jgi:hypothetical protein